MRLRLGLLLLPLLLVAWLVGAGPASAHDQLVGSNPVSGAELAKAPTELRLTFSDTVGNLGAAIKVTDAAGHELQTGKPAINDTVVTQQLKATTTPGTVQVVWRVTSADGHPVTGDFDYSIKGAAGTSTSATTATDLQRSSSGNTDDGTSWATSVPSFQQPTDKTNNEPLIIVGLALLGVIVIGGIAALIRLRGRSDDDDLR